MPYSATGSKSGSQQSSTSTRQVLVDAHPCLPLLPQPFNKMNHSTTNTASYTLSKYSRAYPGKKSAQSSSFSATGPAVAQVVQEWQHFTNPVIRVLLDTKVSKDKDIESVKLRIIWQINACNDEHFSQQDVVFEDMDLLSFSSVAAPVAKKHQTEGLPLKAVYRDTTVGFRYFYSRDSDGITPVYRRFQISFQSLSEASDFIELIKPICPCRLNPSSAPSFAVPRSQVASNIRENSIQTHHKAPTNNSMLPYRGSPLVNVSVLSGIEELGTQSGEPTLSSQMQTSPMLTRPCHPYVSSSLGQELHVKNDSFVSSNCDNALRQSASVTPLSTNNFSKHQNKVIPEQFIIPSTEIMGEAQGPSTSSLQVATLPNSGSTIEKVGMPCTPASVVSHKEAIQSAIAGLAKDANIYRLSGASLEQAICEIIQEEEFHELVERISEMASVRRVANV